MLLIRYCFVFLCRIIQHCRQCSSVTFVTPNNVKNIGLFAFNFPQHLSQVSILVGKAIIRQYRKGLLQWGKTTQSGEQTLPISFTDSGYAVVSTFSDNSSSDSSNNASFLSLSKIRVYARSGVAHWIAIGK